MPQKPLRVLVSAQAKHYGTITASFEMIEAIVSHSENAAHAVSAIDAFLPDTIVLMPESASDLGKLVRHRPVIVVAENPTPQGAVQALRAGAFNYVALGEPLGGALREVNEQPPAKLLHLVPSSPPTPAEGSTSQLTITWGPSALSQLEREAIGRALEATGGNRTHAARLLGIQRLALMRAMARHGMKTATQRGRPRKHQ